MRFAAVRTMLAFTLLAALSTVATADDVWLTDFEPGLTGQLASANDGFNGSQIGSDSLSGEFELPAPKPQGEIVTDANSWSNDLLTTDTACEGKPACGDCCEGGPKRRIYADGEVMALRAHFGETAVGKLAEKYEMSERLVLGVENTWGAGGRIRYWSYDRTTPLLTGAGNSIRFDFDVVDFEGTNRFSTQRFDLVIAGGLRWADIKIDIDSGRSRNDMPGGTIAADLRALVCRDCDRGLVWHSITGARMSIFGGDWEGGNNGLITPTRDDNITVLEIYGGIECSCDCGGHDFYARLLFESQNWRSDALGANTGVDSLSFIGPGVSVGMIY